MALPQKTKNALLIAVPALLFGATALFWGLSALDYQALADIVRNWLEKAHGTPWALPLVCAIYVLSGAILFPVMALNLVIAMVFGKIWGVVYGLIGALLAAALYFYVGRFARRRHFSRLLDHSKIRRIDRGLHNTGVTGVALLRLVPIAPYTMFNLAAGISSLRFTDYITGTLLAMLPGAMARGIVGDSLMNLFLDPARKELLWLGGGLALWLAIIAGSHIALKKSRKKRPPAGAA